MRHGTTFLLMLVVFVTGAFIWIMEKKTETPGRTRLPEDNVLNIEPESMNYVSFYRDGVFIECVNEHGQWLINRPVRDRADDSAIYRILAVMKMLPKKEVITLQERAARELTFDDYGLSKPRAWIVMGIGTQRRKLMIGGDSPLRDALYIRLDNEDEIIATSTKALSFIPERVDEIRDRRLLRGSPDDITRFEIKRHDRPVLQLLKEGAEWIIHKPVIARADWVKVSSLLETMFAVRIREFISEAMADPISYGVGEDDASLAISLRRRQEQESETVFFGKAADTKKETVYANRKGSSSVYSVNRSHVDAMGLTAADLRDSRLYFMGSDRIRFIGMMEGENILQIQSRNGNDWEITRPYQWPADGKLVSALINRLNAIRITSFINGPATNLHEIGLDAPARVIRVADHIPESGMEGVEQIAMLAGKRERTLKLSGSKPGQECVFARFDDDSQVYQISAASAMTLSVDPLKYRDRVVLNLEAPTIRSIILRKNGIEQSVEQDSKGLWKPVGNDELEANDEVIKTILAEVAALGVSRFESMGRKNLAVYGLQPAATSLTFTLTGEGGISKTLLIGSGSEDLGFYAMLQGQNVVFVLEKEKTDMLVRDLVR